MHIEYEVSFTNTLPSIADILARLIEQTGLVITYDPENCVLSNLEFNMKCALIPDNNIYLLLKGTLKLDYLMGATLSVLVSLGGQYQGHLPTWVTQKWKDVNEDFDMLPNIVTPKSWQN